MYAFLRAAKCTRSPAKGLDGHVVELLQHLGGEPDPLPQGEARVLAGARGDRDDDAVEEARHPLNEIGMAVVDGIERAGVYRHLFHDVQRSSCSVGSASIAGGEIIPHLAGAAGLEEGPPGREVGGLPAAHDLEPDPRGGSQPAVLHEK